ncbi:MAG: hypothetical protein E6K25_03680 [Gammaproteobacteria bacterium]|nr:MAG: hypothetical protein E6K25_03680 [Gammaproteobacteria bacterium]
MLDQFRPDVQGNSPFIVGVSGHRDLDPAELPRLKDAVAAFVTQLKSYLPDTEVHMVVGMAPGADLLVVETALDLNVQVEAVLPMSLDQYAADFEPDTLQHLKELLRHPRVHCVELRADAQESRDVAPLSSVDARNAMYAKLTDTLMHTDGSQDADALGFVSEVEDLDPGTRLVYWAPTARINLAPLPLQRPPCFLSGAGDNTLQAHPSMPPWLKIQLEQFNDYNLEFRTLSASGRLGTPDSLLAPLPRLGACSRSQLLEDINAQYTKADALAVYYQRRSDRLFDLFAIMAFAMGIAYLMYDKLTSSRALLIVYLVMLFTGLGAYYVLEGRRWFSKHLTYRALAETLRARFYLRLAGADHRVNSAEVLALSGIDRFEGFSWIAFVLKSIEPADIPVLTDRPPESPRQRCVEEAWIQNQHRYFTVKVAVLEKRSRRIERLKQALLVSILVVISSLFISGGAFDRMQTLLGISVKNLLTFTLGLMAILLGAWELHQNKMATRELLWQYRNQRGHFARAKALLSRVTSVRRRNEVLAELGKDSLMESYLWTIHRYHREHEPPGG